MAKEMTAQYGDYVITIEESGAVKVSLNGSEYKNTKAALRDIAEEAGFTIDEKWNTRQTGKKLAEYLNTNTPKSGENGVDVLASLKMKYDNAWAFDNGLYLIMENNLYGFADKNGITLVQPQYNDTYDDFVGGMIFVWKNGLGGYVNESGEEVIAPQFKRLGYFKNGYTFVSQDIDGKWGVFDINGNQITPLIYDDISSFTDGKAKVKLNGEEFYIDTNGNRIDEEIVTVDKDASVVFLDDDDNPTEWTIYALESGAIVVHKDEEEVDNTKSALRYIAEYIGFSYDTNWNTRQFGSKLIDFMNEQRAQDNCPTAETDD